MLFLKGCEEINYLPLTKDMNIEPDMRLASGLENRCRSGGPHASPTCNAGSFPILSATMHIMAIRVVEFSNGGYKIRKIFA